MATRTKPVGKRPGRAEKARPEALSERIDVPGARPSAFKLVEWAPDSFHLFRSSRKIGKATKEERVWRARFQYDGKEWRASGESASDLLRLVGAFILAHEARDAAAAPAGKAKGRATRDERISLQFLERARTLRVAEIDELIALCRKRVKPA